MSGRRTSIRSRSWPLSCAASKPCKRPEVTMRTDCCAGRLTFTRFDERFLEKSWEWLNDPEIKRLTLTPDFTRESQARWFARLPTMKDYLIWGLLHERTPIGA